MQLQITHDYLGHPVIEALVTCLISVPCGMQLRWSLVKAMFMFLQTALDRSAPECVCLQLEGANMDRLEIFRAYRRIEAPENLHTPLMTNTLRWRVMDTLQAADHGMTSRHPVLWCPGKKGMVPTDSAFGGV